MINGGMLIAFGAARRWSMLAAYACSGFGGLVYQVTWTRLLTLHVGHTTAAVAAVVAAFMGGLGAGAAIGSRLSARWSPAQCLVRYAALEIVVALYAIVLPLSIDGVTPVLRWAYADGWAGFQLVRTVICLGLVGIPAVLLGATFPISLRAFGAKSEQQAAIGGRLYAANTAGAAAGAIAAGFFLLPAVGMAWTTVAGATGSITAAAIAMLLRGSGGLDAAVQAPSPVPHGRNHSPPPATGHVRLAAAILIITGFAGLLYEVAWTRAVASLLGPTTYAFAGTVSVLITGLALGGAAGGVLVARRVRPYVALSISLTLTSAVVWWANGVLGDDVPASLANSFAAAGDAFGGALTGAAVTVFALLLPAAVGLGLSVPLALDLVGTSAGATRQIAMLYALNTASGVAGTLSFGWLLSRVGLEGSLQVVPALLLVAAAVAAAAAPSPRWRRAAATSVLAVAALGSLAAPSTWDRSLLASGIYKYSRGMPPGMDVGPLLRSGTLEYYRDGQLATVSVRTFAGKRSLSVDGKVDGSNGADMLTQTAVAQIPLLLHEDPDDVLVVGLGTGVTAASAAAHPVERLDVVEISPEIVEASSWFDVENRRVLADPRVRLIVGDARSHLALSSRTYDVIISQPSNPWLAGAAALFTEEAFRAVRARLAPGGIASQWLHTYDMSEADFRSIVATFQAVFPEATLWTIGESDLLLVAATDPLEPRLSQVPRTWTRDAVRADLARVGMTDPFAVVSLWAGGPRTLRRLAAGAERQSDDRMALEFTAPVAAFSARRATQAPFVRSMLDPDDVPPEVRRLGTEASAIQRVQRAQMFERARLFKAAVADYARALELQPLLPAALDGLALNAVPAGDVAFAMDRLSRAASAHPRATGPRLARSRLFAMIGARDEARLAAEDALSAAPPFERGAALERLAELSVEANDRERLERLLPQLDAVDPPSTLVPYYRAVSLFMQERSAEAVALTSSDVSRRPNEAKAWNLHGSVLASLGRRDEARKAFATALKLAPADAAAYTGLGFLDLERRRPAEARHWFGTAVALNPTSTIARDGLRRSGEEPH